MTRVDYSRARNRIALAHERAGAPRDMDTHLTNAGYPTTPGTYARLMTNGIPNRHLIRTLCEIFECPRESMITDHEWATLPECTARTHNHG